MDTQKLPIATACEILGSQVAMAKLLEISPAMVNQLVKGTRPVPVEYCLAIEIATGVTRKELCPTKWHRIWPSLKNSATRGPIDDIELQAAMSQAFKDGVIKDRRDPTKPGRRDLDTKAYAALDAAKGA